MPKPKAEAPAAPGDFTDVGVPALKGLDLLVCADLGPKALDESDLPLFKSRSFVGSGGSLSLLLRHVSNISDQAKSLTLIF